MWMLILFVIFILFCCWKLKKQTSYWKSIGVKQNNWVIPIIGDSWKQLMGLYSFGEWTEHETKNFKGQRYYGVYQFQLPILMVVDPDLVKQITVKDFEHFMDHPNFIPDDVDPLWSKNLVALKGHEWKDMRVTLSPAFTASKMRRLFVLMVDNAKIFTNHFLDLKKDSIDCEMKDVFQRYANDVIANTVFGATCNSLVDKTNEFFMNGMKATNFTGFLTTLKVALLFFYPSFSKIFRFTLFPKDASDFFEGVVKESIEYREQNKVVRPDMINTLLQARNNYQSYIKDDDNTQNNSLISEKDEHIESTEPVKQYNFTDIDIAAQALIFFFAGFEQVSLATSWMAYELAINPDVQKRLIDEIDKTAAENKELTYERLNSMTYMDMVLKETMRKWPVSIVTDRICTKDYIIPAKYPGEKDVCIEKGTTVWIPFYAMHRDSKNFKNPEKFDPERFSPENKSEVNQYAFIPFGVGPRICIGYRFVHMEIKALFYYLLSEFEIVPSEKTEIPMPQKLSGFTLQAKNGFFLRFKKRIK